MTDQPGGKDVNGQTSLKLSSPIMKNQPRKKDDKQTSLKLSSSIVKDQTREKDVRINHEKSTKEELEGCQQTDIFKVVIINHDGPIKKDSCQKQTS